MRRLASLAISLVCIACVAGCLCGCAFSNAQYFPGTWKVRGSDPVVKVIYTKALFKNTAANWKYTLGVFTDTITYTYGESKMEAEYSFNEKHTVLTVVQQDEDGNDVTTVFEKVSNDTTGKASVG